MKKRKRGKRCEKGFVKQKNTLVVVSKAVHACFCCSVVKRTMSMFFHSKTKKHNQRVLNVFFFSSWLFFWCFGFTHFFFFQMRERTLSTVFFDVLFALLCLRASSETIKKFTSAEALVDAYSQTSSPITDTIVLENNVDFTTFSLPLGSSQRCVEFRGTLSGSGKTLLGIYANAPSDPNGGFAGLFCKLGKGTKIENLVIDASCVIQGDYAGALAGFAEGEVSISNVTNHAKVIGSGDKGSGGFIGVAHNSKLSIKQSTFDGTVDGSGGGSSGGFVGLVSGLSSSTVTIDNCKNNGNITFGTACGGFVGAIASTSNTVVNITNSVSGGNLKTEGYYAAGFIGQIYDSTIVHVAIINSTNNCNINGDNTKAGGLIGSARLKNGSPVNIFIQNCANNGNLSTNATACGLFCVEPGLINKGTVTVVNCINKGNLNAPAVFGIANETSKVSYTVSMGHLNGSSVSHAFWEKCNEYESLFCLKDECTNSVSVSRSFIYDKSTGCYELEYYNICMHDFLNENAFKSSYGMFWTKELNLVHKQKVTVRVTGEFEQDQVVDIGTKLCDLDGLKFYFNKKEEYAVVTGGTGERWEYQQEFRVLKDTDLIVGKRVKLSFGVPYNDKTVNAVTGEVLERELNEIGFVPGTFIVADSQGMEPLNNQTIINGATNFLFCHNVTASGMLNSSFLVEYNKTLSSSRDLSDYLTAAYVITNKTNTSQILTNDTLVTADLDIAIAKVTILEVIISFDDVENITEDDVEDTIRDLNPDAPIIGVDVIRRDDGSFVVSVKSNEEGSNGILDSLTRCLSASSQT